jgi:hypothetical protein
MATMQRQRPAALASKAAAAAISTTTSSSSGSLAAMLQETLSGLRQEKEQTLQELSLAQQQLAAQTAAATELRKTVTKLEVRAAGMLVPGG